MSSFSSFDLGFLFMISLSDFSVPNPIAGNRSVPKSIDNIKMTVRGNGIFSKAYVMKGYNSGTLLVST